MKQLKLATSIIAPRAANGGWRHPLAQSYIQKPLTFFTHVAQMAERGKFDFMFIPDFYSVFATTDAEFERNINIWYEPVTLLSALTAVTQKIGLSVTLSTTYMEPYHVARMVASLDHLSNGRACWNIVTSRGNSELGNFSPYKRPTIAERDAHATLFIKLVKALWDSWEADAIVEEKHTGVFALPHKIHPVHHRSEWFSVQAPLNVARPLQGYPVLMQAGKSEAFRERAVKTSEVLFTQLNNFEEAQQFYQDVKERAEKHHIAHNHIIIMPGLVVIVAETEALALEKQQNYEQFDYLASRNDRIALFMGLDMRTLTLDMPLPTMSNMGEHEKYAKVVAIAKAQQLTTIRELYNYLEKTTNHHLTLVGTPVQIADEMERWLREEAADGFILLPHFLPAALDDFVEHVVPELQRRGIFRNDYEGSMLREHLGLPFPVNSLQADEK